MRSQIVLAVSLAALWTMLPGAYTRAAGPNANSQAVPAAESTAPALTQSVFPATGTHETILTVPSFGRYAITVTSAQGTALQLVDRMAGPGDIQGAPGSKDGRIDAFLERGAYKIRLISDARGSGKATLAVTPFTELQTTPLQLVEDKPVLATLGDDEQRSWWIVVQNRGLYDFEAGGRYLTELRLWQTGSWMVDAAPLVAESDANPSQPLAMRQLVAQLEPGVYRLTAYGGPSLPWAQDSPDKPFMLRWGIPSLSDSGFFLVSDLSQNMVAALTIDLDTALPWRRRFNLLNPEQTFLYTGNPVDLRVDGAGVNASFVIDRFMTNPPFDRSVPDPKPSGGIWTLTPGYYVLTASPLLNGRGILTLSLCAKGSAPQPAFARGLVPGRAG